MFPPIGTPVDIDELRQAQAALRQSERRYAEAITAGRVGVFDYDLERGDVYADPTLPGLLGHPANAHPSGEAWLERIHPIDRRRIMELGRSVLQHAAVVRAEGTTAIPEIECRVVRPGNRMHWVALRGKVLHRDDGVPQRIIGTVSDVSARKRAELKLQERLRFETLLSELSAVLAMTSPRRTDEVIPDWLRRIGEFLKAERVSVARMTADMGTLDITHTWVAAGLESAIDDVPSDVAALILEHARRGALMRHVSGMASEARVLLGVPLMVSGRPLGMLLLVGGGRMWPRAITRRLQVMGRLLANVLGRKQLEATMRQSEALNAAVLASIAGQVAILDRSGIILQVNETWASHALEHRNGNGASPGPTQGVGVGMDYLEVCRRAANAGDHRAADILEGLQTVLLGRQTSFSCEYRCSLPDTTLRGNLPGTTEVWYEMWASRLARREGGAIVFYLDCTARKHAEAEAQRHRQELAHVLRVATMGELASSLAHELYQPLTAILSNAQTACRLLDAPVKDLGEVRGALTDIVLNDRRASAIVRHMHAFMKKGELELHPIDPCDLVRDVVHLVHADLVLRQATITLDLEAPAPKVRGDRVQLQQVLLNFVLNGLEAMAETPPRERRLAVRAARRDARSVDIAVRDTGSGIPREHLDRVFDAFFTTKPGGLGMGLSIARTIVEAHGGRIWAVNNFGRGATVGFTVPAEWE